MTDADKTPEEFDAEYRAWLLENFGTLKVVKSVATLIAQTKEDPRWSGQIPSLEAALELVHPETGEPLVYTICDYTEGYEFNEKAILMTASDKAVEGRWVDEKWVLS